MNQLIPIVYLINKDKFGTDVKIEATLFDAETNLPISWAVRIQGSAMSKTDGIFCNEPSPSSRLNKFLKEYRFKTAQKALDSYIKFGYQSGLHDKNDNPNYIKLTNKITQLFTK